MKRSHQSPEAQPTDGVAPTTPTAAPSDSIWPLLETCVLLAKCCKRIGPDRIAEIMPLTFNRARIIVTDDARHNIFDSW
jgi:hypothetical protein